MLQILYSSKFKKSLRRMPQFVKKTFFEREELFLINPFHPFLETHKLHGKYKDFWAFTIIGQYRILFKFIEKKKIIGFFNIGTHEIYK